MPKNNKTILINVTTLLTNPTGVGQVVYEISRRLEKSHKFNVMFSSPWRTYQNLDDVVHHRPLFYRLAEKIIRKLPLKNTLRRLSMKRSHKSVFDLYWEPNHIPIDSIQAKHIVTTVHDMSCFDHPEFHPNDRVTFYQKHFRQNVSNSDMIITVSEFSKNRFLDYQKNINEEQVKVIPCGVDSDIFRKFDQTTVTDFRQRIGLPENFILFVGTMEPRKNLLNLLNGYETLSDNIQRTYPLVLVGDNGWNNKDIYQKIESMKDKIIQVGYLEKRHDLALLYNAASIFVFPSLYEGFGIPPLEAMACGTPVCISSIPVFHEVFGKKDICYVDPFSPISIGKKITQLIIDKLYQKRNIEKGFEISKKYTWDNTFNQYVEIFTKLLEKDDRSGSEKNEQALK